MTSKEKALATYEILQERKYKKERQKQLLVTEYYLGKYRGTKRHSNKFLQV